MTATVANPRRVPAAAPTSEPYATPRPTAIWKHAILLGVLLVAVLPFVGTTGQFSADEGAALVQADHVASGEGWTFSHPFPEVDPGGESFPYELSSRVDDRYLAFGKHPLYVVLLGAASRVGGQAGAMFLSIVGTVLAATLIALITARFDRRLTIPALWAAGLATPLMFDGYLVIAHTLGAAACAAAVLVALRAGDKQLSPRLATAGVAVAVAAGVLLRTEALVFAVALAVAVAAWGHARRHPGLYAVCAGALVGAAGAAVLERWWTAQIVGGSGDVTRPLGAVGRDGLGGRIGGLIITTLLPSYRLDLGAALRLVALGSAVAAAYVVRRRPADRDGVRLFIVVSVAAAMVAAAMHPTAAPGLLPTMPFLAAGLLGLTRPARASAEFLLGSTTLLFAGAVIATQYASGGSAEWGWRYFAVGLPCLVPLCVVGIDRLRTRIDRPTLRLAGACVCLGSLATAVLAVRSVQQSHHTVDRIIDAIEVTTAGVDPGDGGTPIVLATAGATARFAWRFVETQRWLTVAPEDLPAAAQRLRAADVGRVIVVVRNAGDAKAAEGLGEVLERRSPSGTWTLLTIDISGL